MNTQSPLIEPVTPLLDTVMYPSDLRKLEAANYRNSPKNSVQR